MNKLINGSDYSKTVLSRLKKEVSVLRKKRIIPQLAIVQVGSDKASNIYVSKKIKAAENIGVKGTLYSFSSKTSEKKLLGLINKLNNNKKVHGIIVQLPLPKHINKLKIINSVSSEKDVDGFTYFNLGKTAQNEKVLVSATPKACMALLEKYKVNLKGAHCVIINDSVIVGKPLAMLLLNEGATVTVCNKFTKNLSAKTRQADILFSAVGKPNFIKSSMVKKGFIGIDIGIVHLKNNKVVGDFAFNSLKKKAKLITPVPGGVGPMTVAMLLENTVLAAKQQAK